MKKQQAISLLGGSNKSVAKAIGISQQAVSLWPDELTSAISDRVEAAYFRLNGQKIPVSQSQQSGASVEDAP
ncbi:hypothetical protein [Limnohabitans sp.]|uniref:hypothetical protein n=1 Tax=Limnohabitans sp. TaxID=1907725 RepID=UPI00286FA859|nr:hypothetical protein [Limnohabitans sp.]